VGVVLQLGEQELETISWKEKAETKVGATAFPRGW